MTPVLRKYTESIGVRFLDRVMVTDLIKKNDKVAGAVGFPMDEESCYVIQSKATVIYAGRNYFKSPGMNISGQTGYMNRLAGFS